MQQEVKECSMSEALLSSAAQARYDNRGRSTRLVGGQRRTARMDSKGATKQ